MDNHTPAWDKVIGQKKMMKTKHETKSLLAINVSY